jgi:hypothetical protein
LAVSTQTFSQFVSNSVAAIQGVAAQLIDMTVGSVLRSFVDAYSLLALWFQATALQTASLTRLATSFGADVDSFIADFGFSRGGGTLASGAVTFARFTPTAIATIPAATQTGTTSEGLPIFSGGSVVQTATGVQQGIQYQVIPDTTQPAFNVAQNAYVIPAGTSSITATVQALLAGSGGNVVVGAINTIAAPIPGVDTVTNAAAFDNGADPQTDAQVKAGFPSLLQSLRSATPAAIQGAIAAIGENVDFTYTENVNLDGSPHPGFFFIIADNGTGSPPSNFITAVAAAVEAVRGDSITFGVFPPTIVPANVALTIVGGSRAAVTAALTSFTNSLKIGAPLDGAVLAGVALGVSGVTNVPLSLFSINGSNSDLMVTDQQIVKIGTVSILGGSP